MSEASLIRGSCHCGAIKLTFTTTVATALLAPRRCDCTFCVKHGASYVSDPQGSLTIEAQQDALNEYRQGSGRARFPVCRACGVLMGVVFDHASDLRGALNSRCIEGGVAFGATQAISPQNLDVDAKIARWLDLWTPTRMVTPAR